MPRACTICTHPERHAIDKSLAGGATMRELAALYRVSPDALARHNAAHLPARLVREQRRAELVDADDLIAQVRALSARALRLLDSAEREGDRRGALSAVRETRECLGLMSKLLVPEQQQPNQAATVAWQTACVALLAALAPFPEAKAAVAASLVQLEAGA
jgi:hypothetical protein